MRKKFLMKVASLSILAMCSGFMIHTVHAEERPTLEASTSSTEIATGSYKQVNRQDDMTVNNPISHSAVLREIDDHYKERAKIPLL